MSPINAINASIACAYLMLGGLDGLAEGEPSKILDRSRHLEFFGVHSGHPKALMHPDAPQAKGLTGGYPWQCSKLQGQEEWEWISRGLTIRVTTRCMRLKPSVGLQPFGFCTTPCKDGVRPHDHSLLLLRICLAMLLFWSQRLLKMAKIKTNKALNLMRLPNLQTTFQAHKRSE